ncbi:hypothetical protein GQ54DRAFT_52643 [Martensiomyces pterosporus]|nr:hypothetical protein GQ54DRAFT_52643 [Martensiomyces pterosporus]
MSDGGSPDLYAISATPDEGSGSPSEVADARHEASENSRAPAQKQSQAKSQDDSDESSRDSNSPATPVQETGGKTASGKNKRPRRTSKGDKKSNTEKNDSAGDDFKLHVDAEWSEDEKEEKEHSAKRIAAAPAAQDSGPVAVKKGHTALDSFTIRAVVTRKDVEVIFEHEEGKKEELEEQTGASISIVAGKDDPDIVVDRVLVIKGPIANVATAYLHIAEGMLAIKMSAARQAAEKEVAAAEETSPAADPDAAADGDADGATDKDTDKDSGASKTADSKAKETPSKDSGSKITLRILVPHKCVGSIMGHGGKTINNIRDTSTVNIHTSESTLPRSSERIVELVGTPPSIQKAIKLIAEALTKDMAAYNSADYYVPAANLPSAMTVETQSRKRKDGKRQGHTDSHQGNRGHDPNIGNSSHGHNRGNGYRNNNGGYNNNSNNNSNARNYNKPSNNNRDRHDRYNRHNDRQGGRSRGPGSMSNVNRTPIGNTGPGPSPGQPSFRMPSQPGGARAGAAPAMSYGYAVPAASGYPAYGTQAAGAAVAAGPPNSRYGGSISGAAPVPAASPYTSGYNAAPSPYQFPAPVSYGYTAAPMQNMYSGRPAQPSGGYQPRPYAPRGGRPQMPQAPMSGGGSAGGGLGGGGLGGGGLGGASSAAGSGGMPGDASGQTIQQIYVPSDKIGAVIGRRGETINEIRRTTNARVDIQDSAQGAQQRLVIITGGYDQVRSAYYMIKNKVDMARPALRP